MNELNLSNSAAEYVQTSIKDSVLTIMMNKPKKLNGWTQEMMDAFKEALAVAAKDDSSKAVILTGAGHYYSAGVNFGGTLKPMHPKKLHKMIVEHNQKLFEVFLNFPKPILVAMNGPAIGASVTSATLCDGIIASENATFATPFAALGITPEGCSSIHFSRLMGEAGAQRMLGSEGWKPTASEALAAGLIQWMVPHEQLLDEAHAIAKDWVEKGQGRTFLAGSQLQELKDANARESLELADAFLGADFLREQFKFSWGKKKRAPAIVFLTLWLLRPLWKHLA
ncbi:MAG: enoyl-CoA hydratase/isomerase family protein [Bermanella sp.]